MPGKRLNSQAQELALKLIDYFKLEKANGAPLIRVNSIYQRVSDALGISTVLVGTIKKRKELNPVLSSPGKKRPRRKIKTADLPEATKMEVRNALYNMYKEGKHVTLTSLRDELNTKHVVQLGRSSLNSLLNNIVLFSIIIVVLCFTLK